MRKYLFVLWVSTSLLAGAERTERRPRKLWLWSVGALIAANVVDAHSSWSYPERNGLLRSAGGQFGARAVGIKSGIAGAVIGIEWLAGRKIPRADPIFATVNFATGAAMTRTAIHNYRLQQFLRAGAVRDLSLTRQQE